MKLLLVEDDLQLGHAVRDALAQIGHVVDWVRRGDDAVAAVGTGDYAVLLLDLNLPELSGLEVLRCIRARRGAYLPVIVITARDRQSHRIEGLDAGADDYLVKPFDLGELAARIRAQVRRQDSRASDTIVHRDVELDLAGQTVRYRDRPIALTAREFKVLALLMRRIGRFVPKADVEEAIYDNAVEIESNTVEVAISAIRRKIARDVIVTARGLGYSVPR